MRRARVGEIELEFETVGVGNPVVLIHGGNVAREFEALTRESVLNKRYHLIRYHRRGMANSSPLTRPTSIREQALDVLGLLDHCELTSAHLVGHSLGGVIALEVGAIDPERVRSLVLLEPILRDVPSAPQFFERLAPVFEAYSRDEIEVAARGMFEFIGGPNWQDRLVESGLLDDAIRDAPTFFEFERPALAAWNFDAARASIITCPVLSVVGTASGRFFVEGRDLLHSWFPHCMDADLVGVTHFLESEDPKGVADAIASFLSEVDPTGHART